MPPRKSIGNKARNDIPRAGDFELLDTVRKRSHKTLKTIISAANKLKDDDVSSALSLMREELVCKWLEYVDAFGDH